MFCEWDERGRGEAGGEGRSLSTPHCAPPQPVHTHLEAGPHTRAHTQLSATLAAQLCTYYTLNPNSKHWSVSTRRPTVPHPSTPHNS